MGRRVYSIKSIKYWWTYDVDEICALLNVHSRTVYKWIKADLLTTDENKPILIYGNDLKDFLEKQNDKNKCKTEFNEMYCFKCHDAKSPYKRQVTLAHQGGYIVVKSLCRDHKHEMRQNYKLDDLQKLKSVFNIVDMLELYDSDNPSCNTHLKTQSIMPTNEPAQMELVV